uniref:(northern house mosquito) hypothetical protein n=1 Tax=Culex pipiens TaxID=7175 RepID=A0A8D8IUZ9_CULPI
MWWQVCDCFCSGIVQLINENTLPVVGDSGTALIRVLSDESRDAERTLVYAATRPQPLAPADTRAGPRHIPATAKPKPPTGSACRSALSRVGASQSSPARRSTTAASNCSRTTTRRFICI